MTLRTKYILYIVIIHLVIIVLTFELLSDYRAVFIASEILVVISLLISVRLFRDFYAPIRMLLSGTDAIKDKDFNIKYVKTGNKELDQLIEAYNGMIDKLREERTHQQEQHYFLEKLIHASPVGILILTLDNQISSSNPKLNELIGFPDKNIIGATFPLPDSPLLQHIAAIPTGESATITLEGFRTYKCQKSHFLSRGFHYTFIMVEELTSERLKIEKEAYGQVIRMMAHEVNNTIGPINSILDSVNRFLKPDEQAHEPYREALEVAYNRNQRLNQFMRNFADVVRLPFPNRHPENLQQLLTDIHILMQAQAADKAIDFQLHLPEEPQVLSADKQQLEQAFVNIIKNAFEAVDHQPVVQILLEKQRIVIRNNGKGIPVDIAPQIFSPFFSNKTAGQGIGLTLTKEILLNHGLDFALTTKKDKWTEFEVFLPK